MTEPEVEIQDASRERAPVAALSADAARLRGIVDTNMDFVARTLRRLGVSVGDVEDAAQQVFLVVHEKLALIEPDKVQAFLLGITVRVASHARRSRFRRDRTRAAYASEAPSDATHSASDPESLALSAQARVLLDQVLDQMPLELRLVFVLFELEEMMTADIALLLSLPTGTVASRLRRARRIFSDQCARLERGDLRRAR